MKGNETTRWADRRALFLIYYASTQHHVPSSPFSQTRKVCYAVVDEMGCIGSCVRIVQSRFGDTVGDDVASRWYSHRWGHSEQARKRPENANFKWVCYDAAAVFGEKVGGLMSRPGLKTKLGIRKSIRGPTAVKKCNDIRNEARTITRGTYQSLEGGNVRWMQLTFQLIKTQYGVWWSGKEPW